MKQYKIHNKLQYGTIFRRIKAWNRVQDRKIRIYFVPHEILIFNYDKWGYQYFGTWKDKVELVANINKLLKMKYSRTYDYYASNKGRLPALEKQVSSVL